MAIPPKKWQRFSDSVLDSHLEALFNYLGNINTSSSSGTGENGKTYTKETYLASGFITREEIFTTSSRTTKLGQFDYAYDSSNYVTKITEKVYNLGRQVATNTYRYAYLGGGKLDTITKSVV